MSPSPLYEARLSALHLRHLIPPGTGEVFAQYPATLPAFRPVIRYRNRIRGVSYRVPARLNVSARLVRSGVSACDGPPVRGLTIVPVRTWIDGPGRIGFSVRRNDITFPVTPSSSLWAVPVEILAAHERHELATAFGIDGDCHGKNLSPSSGTA